MKNDQLIDTLNKLIQVSKDGEEGYRVCAENATEHYAYHKNQFLERSEAYSQMVLELQNLVRSLDGDPVTHSSVTGTLHRQWVHLKAAIVGKDDDMILSECERGEDASVNIYRKALAEDLPSHVRLIVERQYLSVLVNHDRVKALRDQVRAKKAA